jgi:hypothetical protein
MSVMTKGRLAKHLGVGALALLGLGAVTFQSTPADARVFVDIGFPAYSHGYAAPYYPYAYPRLLRPVLWLPALRRRDFHRVWRPSSLALGVSTFYDTPGRRGRGFAFDAVTSRRRPAVHKPGPASLRAACTRSGTPAIAVSGGRRRTAAA